MPSRTGSGADGSGGGTAVAGDDGFGGGAAAFGVGGAGGLAFGGGSGFPRDFARIRWKKLFCFCIVRCVGFIGVGCCLMPLAAYA